MITPFSREVYGCQLPKINICVEKNNPASIVKKKCLGWNRIVHITFFLCGLIMVVTSLKAANIKENRNPAIIYIPNISVLEG
jgi:hypothetical protein